MISGASYRGQPLVALLLILGGWIAARAILWDAASVPAAQATVVDDIGGDLIAQLMPKPSAALAHEGAGPERFVSYAPAPPSSFRGQLMLAPTQAQRLLAGLATYRPSPRIIAEAVAFEAGLGEVTSSHQLLWMAAMGQLPVPAAVASSAEAPKPATAMLSPSRWSADGWVVSRRGGGVATASGLAPATYGASQAGAVLRYRLDIESANRPAIYARASAALNGSHEREGALGLSARPIAQVPLVAAVEARVFDRPGATQIRPAGFVYTELPPVRLPMGLQAELYGQAGYVGGNFATAFVDGQLKADRRVAKLGDGELRAGGGVWGGAQKGASRLDVGPSATVGLPLGGSASARVAVDWRFRVTGNAEPDSGPAVTVSAGF